MNTHRQTCQNCNSRSLRNLIVRSPGKKDRIFVQCRKCRQLVARYILGEFGYYHHGKGIESFVHNFEATGEVSSGKNMMKDLQKTSEEALQGLNDALEYLESAGKNDDLETDN